MDALDFVSTDAHSARYRKPIISEGLKELEKAVGKDKVSVVIDASYRVVDNGKLP